MDDLGEANLTRRRRCEAKVPATEAQQPAADPKLRPRLASNRNRQPSAAGEAATNPQPVPEPSAAPGGHHATKTRMLVNVAPEVAKPVNPPAATEVAVAATPTTVSVPALVAPTPMHLEQTPRVDRNLPDSRGRARPECGQPKLLKDVYQGRTTPRPRLPEAKRHWLEGLLDRSQQAKDDAAAAVYGFSRSSAHLAIVDAANPELVERAIGMLAGRLRGRTIERIRGRAGRNGRQATSGRGQPDDWRRRQH